MLPTDDAKPLLSPLRGYKHLEPIEFVRHRNFADRDALHLVSVCASCGIWQTALPTMLAFVMASIHMHMVNVPGNEVIAAAGRLKHHWQLSAIQSRS